MKERLLLTVGIAGGLGLAAGVVIGLAYALCYWAWVGPTLVVLAVLAMSWYFAGEVIHTRRLRS